jgi:cysteine desulfurase
MSLSGHKIGGPKGIGALVVGAGTALSPLLTGGGQERRRRAGTENVVAIAGFGAAAKAAKRELADMDRVAAMRDQLEAEVLRLTPDAIIIGKAVPRLANTSCIAVPGQHAETLVIKFDLAGVAVSAGSACSSGKVAASHVLTAMGFAPEVASSAIRVSIGTSTTEQDIAAFLAAWKAVSGKSQLAA